TRPSAQAAAPNVAVGAPSAPAASPASGTAAQPEAPPVASAPAFDRAAAADQVRGAVARFVAAFETRKIDEVRRVYPGMSVESATRWQALLGERTVTDLKTAVARTGTPEFDGDDAEVSFAMSLEFKAGGKRQSQELPYTAKLRRDGGAWRIIALSGR
ncbi:MAG: hypothetical protein ACJ8AO_12910, partial [Gemmatimonadaceae bacterium]